MTQQHHSLGIAAANLQEDVVVPVHACQVDAGFEPAISVPLGQRVIDELRNGTVGLPGFVREEDQNGRAVFRWQSPQTGVPDHMPDADETDALLPTEEEVELRQKEPILARIREHVESKLAIQMADAGSDSAMPFMTSSSW